MKGFNMIFDQDIVEQHVLWKSLFIVSLALPAVANILLTTSDSVFPRPWYYFALLGTSTVFVTLLLFVSQTDREIILCLLSVIIIGVCLRISGYLVVISSGLDYGRWIARAALFISEGAISGNDMYAASPLYLLELTISKQILGISVFSTRFITILASSGILLFVYSLTRLATNSAKVGVLSSILILSQPFYLRTASLLESESLAIPLFALTVLLFLKLESSSDTRFLCIYGLILFSIISLHFFYATITILVLSLSHILLAGYKHLTNDDLRDLNQSGFLITLGALVALPVWMLWSVYAHTAVITLVSVLSIPEPTSLISIFLPSGGEVGASTVDSSSTGSPINTILKLMPVVLLFASAGLGGVFTLVNRKLATVGLLVLSTLLVLLTFGALVAGFDYNLEYRLYYFLGLLACSFSAIIMYAAIENTTNHIGPVICILLILIMSLLGPVSPLGNNVDPMLGGSSWAITESDYTQLESMNKWSGEGESATVRIPQYHSFFAPSVDSNDVYLGESCVGRSSKLGTTGTYTICQLSETS